MKEITHKAEFTTTAKFTTFNDKQTLSIDKQELILKFDNHIVSTMPTDKLEKLLEMVQ